MNRLILLGTVHRDPDGKKRLLRFLEEIDPTAISLEVSPASITLRRQWSHDWLALFRHRLAEISRNTGQKRRQILAGHGLHGVFEYLRLPYEYRASLAHARRRDRPVFLLDDSRLAESYLSRVEREILGKDNLTLLAKERRERTLAEEVAAEYVKASRLVLNQNAAPSSLEGLPRDQEHWTAREESLARKLRLLHQGLVKRAGQRISGKELSAGLIIAADAVAHMPETTFLRPDLTHLYIGGWEHLIEDEAGHSLYCRLKDIGPERMLCHRPRL
ncbi:MAG: hypothetical protein AB1641_10180 [Thermodesulfobacteriota bacterium]